MERLEQERTEPAAMRIGVLEPVVVQYHQEKILGKVLRIFHGTAALAGDGENRPPINPAKLGQRVPRRLLSTFGLRGG